MAERCTPDFVLPSRRIAVFVDGDFWHSCPRHGKHDDWSGPNAKLWAEKMARNVARDLENTRSAEEAGWTVVRVWECTIRRDVDGAAQAVLDGVSPDPI